MSVLIIGANGNMGKRYQAILSQLSIPFHGIDREVPVKEMRALADDHDGVLIVTPTDTHLPILEILSDLKKPILCEKPLTKDVEGLKTVIEFMKRSGTPLSMVYQYSLISDPFSRGNTSYDFFKHGNDGLVWDCLQIIALARSSVSLAEKSPVWKCQINGKSVDLGLMDYAYVWFVEDWIRGNKQDPGTLVEIHEKVKTFETEWNYAGL